MAQGRVALGMGIPGTKRRCPVRTQTYHSYGLSLGNIALSWHCHVSVWLNAEN